MKNSHLMHKYNQFLNPKTIQDALFILHTQVNFIIKMGYQYNKFYLNEYHAGTILQMLSTKNIYLQQMLEGIEFKTDDNVILNNILDPGTIIPHIRTIYELLGVFETVFVLPETKEKKALLLNLWQIGGLKYRQKFGASSLSEHQQLQMDDEKDEIEKLIEQVKKNPIYKLSERNKNIIDDQIKNKKWQITIDSSDNVNSFSLAEIPALIRMNRGNLFDSIYNYSSMYAHGSYIGVMQFDQMFKERDDIQIILVQANNAIFMYSVFISDYIKLFSETKEMFFDQSIETQMFLRMHAKMIRKEAIDLDKNWCQK